jgi:trk system potassium uptake protein TrkA
MKYMVIGLGAFGKTLAMSLMENEVEVVAIDSNMEMVDEIQDDVTYAVCLDSTDEKALLSLGLEDFDFAIVCIGGDFEATLLTSVLLKNGGVKHVITRASDPIHIKILKAVGIDEIITPEIEVAEKLSYRLIYKNLFDIIHIDDSIAVVRIKAPETFVGKTIGELNLRAKYKINVIAIEEKLSKDIQKDKKQKIRKGLIVNNTPGAETVINEEDVLIVTGDAKDLKKLTIEI